MRRIVQILLFGLISLFCFQAFAQVGAPGEDATKVQAKPKEKPLGIVKYKRFWRFCPSVDELIYNNQSWGAKGHWETMGLSFATEVTAFEGIHWTGVNLGTVACLYKGSGVTFPIAIGQKSIVLKPEGRFWTSDKSGTSWACIRSDPKDCPFVFRDQISNSAKSIEVIYQEIRSLKGS
jgi:hypothetical protein